MILLEIFGDFLSEEELIILKSLNAVWGERNPQILKHAQEETILLNKRKE